MYYLRTDNFLFIMNQTVSELESDLQTLPLPSKVGNFFVPKDAQCSDMYAKVILLTIFAQQNSFYVLFNFEKILNRTKKVIHAKNEGHINSNLPCKFGHFRGKLNIWGACGALTRYDVIYNFTLIIFSAHCASCMSRWPLLWGKVCISVIRKEPKYICLAAISRN